MLRKIITYLIKILQKSYKDYIRTSLFQIKGANIKIHNSILIESDCRVKIDKNSIVCIGKLVEFRQFCSILVFKHARLSISDGVFFNNYCSINCLGTIEIGENTLFGEGVKIYDHNHKHGSNNNGQLLVARNEFKTGIVKIGSNCWIGSNVTILSNVTIGDNVIVGAGVLVHKSIPSNTIVKLRSEVMMEKRDNNNG